MLIKKRVDFNKKKEILIVTSVDPLYGLGHHNRMQVLKREIIESLSIVPKLIKINFILKLKYVKKKY